MGAFAARVGRCGSGAGGFRDKTPRVRMADLPAADCRRSRCRADLGLLRVNFCSGRTRRWKMMGLLSHRWRKTEQPRLPYRSPRSRKPYGTPLQRRWGCPGSRLPGEASSAGRRSLLAAAAGQPAQTAALKNLRTDGEPAVRPGEVVAAEVSGEAAKASSSEVAKASSGEVAKASSGDTAKAEASGERASKQASGRPATRSAAGAAGPCGVLRRAVRSLHQTA